MYRGKRSDPSPSWSSGRSGVSEMLVFRKQETSVPGLLSKIKNEAAVWAMAGAKDLESLILRE